MESMLKKLPELDDRQQKIVRKLTKSIVNQMMRDPILRVKELAAERGGDESLEMFAHLFALEPILEEQKREEERLQAEAAREANKGKTPLFRGKGAVTGS